MIIELLPRGTPLVSPPVTEVVELDDRLSVITGRNGAGKSRFLSFIASGHYSLTVGGSPINGNGILYIQGAQLAAKLNDPNKETERMIESTRGQMLLLYKNQSKIFDLPYDDAIKSIGQNSSLFPVVYGEVHRIARKAGVRPSEVSVAELGASLVDPSSLEIGEQNLTKLYSDYVNRLHQNLMNRFFVSQGSKVAAFTDEEFKIEYGPEPWIRLNEIIQEIFVGKFSVVSPTVPPPTKEKVVVRAQIVLTATGEDIQPMAFSSGEKVLLWLAIALFNMQYSGRWSQKSKRLLLLDEADACLHPKMVHTLLKVLALFYEHFEMPTIFVTHSPTTVALAPSGTTFLMKDGGILPVGKDVAIGELLDGISSISIDPENRRQVYVESIYDAEAYQEIYQFLKAHSDWLEPDISISFASAGAKMPRAHIHASIQSCFAGASAESIEKAINLINGSGSCSQVIGIVNELTSAGNRTVRGIVDWDQKNASNDAIAVLGEGGAYAIENILLDPLIITLWMHLNKGEALPSASKWNDWLTDSLLLQESFDNFIIRILDRANKKDCVIKYSGGVQMSGDSGYLLRNGHELEKSIITKIPQLREIIRGGADGGLKVQLAKRVMVAQTAGRLIPMMVIDALRHVQR